MPRSTLRCIGLIGVVTALLVGPTGRAAPAPEPPSASPSGGERLRVLGNAELTREQLAESIRNYRPPDSTDFNLTGGEDHDDDEAPARPAAGLAPIRPTIDAGAVLESPLPTSSWNTNIVGSVLPADAQIAASTTHVVVTNNMTASFFDKAGTWLGTMKATDIFKPLGLNSIAFFPAPIDTYFDVRVIFDPFRKRFWLVGIGVANGWKSLPPGFMRHVTAIAVSKTEDPREGWWVYWLDAVSHYGIDDEVFDYGDVSDYPTLGIDSALLHETHAVNNFDFLHNKTFRYWRVTFFGADQMAAGANGADVPAWQYWDLHNPDGTAPTRQIQAVVHHTVSARSFYVSRLGADQLVVWSLTKPFQAGQKVSAVAVAMPSPFHDPFDAPQPVDPSKPLDKWIKMTNLGTNPLKAVFRGGLLHVVTNVGVVGFTGARYIRLLTDSYPAIVTDAAHKFLSLTFGWADAIEGGGFAWAGWPAVDVNKAGDAAMVFARSSEAIAPQVRYTTHMAGEPDMRWSRLLKEGESTYHDGLNPPCVGCDKTMRWGDVGGAAVDPKDDTGIWIAQQYATSGAAPNYGIWVGKVFGGIYYDLSFLNVRVDSVDRTMGEIVIAGQVHNGGDGSSPDAEVSVSIVNGTRRSLDLGKLTQGPLRPGEDGDFRATFALPRNLEPGTYQLNATITTKTARNEYSTGNNTSVAAFDVR